MTNDSLEEGLHAQPTWSHRWELGSHVDSRVTPLWGLEHAGRHVKHHDVEVLH